MPLDNVGLGSSTMPGFPDSVSKAVSESPERGQLVDPVYTVAPPSQLQREQPNLYHLRSGILKNLFERWERTEEGADSWASGLSELVSFSFLMTHPQPRISS